MTFKKTAFIWILWNIFCFNLLKFLKYGKVNYTRKRIYYKCNK